jgi:hypothetical protein
MLHVIRAYDPTAQPPANYAELCARYRSVLYGQRALLLMDNASDREQVEPLIPPATCLLIVTSRQHFTLPGLFDKDLDTLAPDDARQFLLKVAPRIAGHADEIARLCGHLPLALRLAASALAERRDLGVADYVRRLYDAGQRLKLVDVSLTLSYDLLTPEMQKLWRMLVVIPTAFEAEAAAFVWRMEQDAAQDALSELVKYSLVEWSEQVESNQAGGRYRLHDLAYVYARARLSREESVKGMAGFLMYDDVVFHRLASQMSRDRAQWLFGQRYDFLEAYVGEDSTVAGTFLFESAMKDYAHGDRAKAIDCAEGALEFFEEGGDASDAAAVSAQLEKWYEEAEGEQA